MRRTIQCKFCQKHSLVVSRLQMHLKEIIVLECSHRMVLDNDQHEGGGQVGLTNTGTRRDCPLCTDAYTTFCNDAYGKLCLECRDEQKIKTDKDADELLEVIALYKPGELAEIQQQIQQARTVNRQHKHGNDNGKRQLPAAPPVDAEKVAAAIRGMIEYGVLAHEMEKITQPTAYVIAKNGLFHVSHSDIADIVSVPKEVVGVSVELRAGVTLKIPRVPFELLAQVVAFFKMVEKLSGAEALVQVWWQCQEQRYELHVPEQSVSGGGVQHRSVFDQEQARTAAGEAIWLHVMDIHSHNTMGAFWSSVDDGDERKAPEGRMFGVIGKIRQHMPECKWRIRTREGFMELRLDDIFVVDRKAEVAFNVSWDVILSSLQSYSGHKDGDLLLRCPVEPFAGATFPEEWMTRVSGRMRQQHMSDHGGGGWRGQTHQQHGLGFSERTTLPSYIYIKSQDGTKLDEYEMEGSVPMPTGKSLDLIKGGHDGR